MLITREEHIQKMEDEITYTLPDLIIRPWDGEDPIPTDWVVCDGTNGTPDLRSRFLISTDTDIEPLDGEDQKLTTVRLEATGLEAATLDHKAYTAPTPPEDVKFSRIYIQKRGHRK